MPASELTLGVTLAVLAAGLLHASWNALLKAAPGGDPVLTTASVVLGSSACALVAIPFVGLPDPAAWKFIATSLVAHFAYFVTLSQAYRTGDLSFAYPLMRGTAPLLTAMLAIVFVGELPTPTGALGIVLISGGIASIAFTQRGGHPPAAVFWALANAAVIAIYTLIDGAGARASGKPLSYVAWLTFFECVPFLAWIYWHRGESVTGYLIRGWRRGLLGGAASVGAYAIVLWAMTRAPIAAVAALRETSVIFAALIGAVALKEGFSAARFAGAASVVLGIAALKL
jgi:drug/metabolite transporter (DMT)-like permease